jgi:hypothetical protein
MLVTFDLDATGNVGAAGPLLAPLLAGEALAGDTLSVVVELLLKMGLPVALSSDRKLAVLCSSKTGISLSMACNCKDKKCRVPLHIFIPSMKRGN